MKSGWIILCLTYGSTLLLSGLLGFPTSEISLHQGLGLGLTLFMITLLGGTILPRFSYRIPRGKFWVIVGLLAFLSVIYLQVRFPRPTDLDISQWLKGKNTNRTVIITGKTLTEGRLTAQGKIQFLLKVDTVKSINGDRNQSATGKLYVTLPFSENVIYPQQKLTLQGQLYQPQAPRSPASFNFKRFLARQGIFAGLKGEKIQDISPPTWGLWQIRQQIVTRQKAWINEREAALISSMTLGRKAVNLPLDLREEFIQAGMAHVLAASGFHVTLLLGIVIYLTRFSSPKLQLIIGSFLLLLYVGLTGGQPSVLRASLMGVGVLIGKSLDRKVNPTGSLLLAATILLLINPLWLEDLGFQLSFLATFGLLVTLPFLENSLDFLPPRIANFTAIPLAASLWTLPLLMHTFSQVSLYSIPLNILTSPLVYLISLGGIISAIFCLIIPPLGSVIAGLLYWPTSGLIFLVNQGINLPGNSYFTGKLPLGIMLIVYGIFMGVWLNVWCRQRKVLMSLLVMALLMIVPLYNRFFLIQVTLFPANIEPIILIQDRGQSILLNYGDSTTQKYTLLPFLAQQGINRLNCVIKVDNFPYYSPECIDNKLHLSPQMLKNDPNNFTSRLLPFSADKIIKINSVKLQLHPSTLLLQIQIGNHPWIWLFKEPLPEKIPLKIVPLPQVLLWSGTKLELSLLKELTTKTAIALSYPVSEQRRKFFKKYHWELFSLESDHTLTWTPHQGFKDDVTREKFP